MHQHQVICCVIIYVKLMYDLICCSILQTQLIRNSFNDYPIKIT